MATATLYGLQAIKEKLPFDPQPFQHHVKAQEVVDKNGSGAFDSFFSFALVRNPWDWQVSLYNYMLKDSSHYQHKLVKSFKTFDEYIIWRCTKEIRLQKDFIYSEDGELIVDFVGTYENLENDFNYVCSRIGITAVLPKLNVSGVKSYREYYNHETIDLVSKAFEKDILLFKYEY